VSALVNIETARIKTVLEEGRRRAQRRLAVVALAAAAILAAFVYADALDPQRYRDALPTIWTLAKDAMPPDFTRWRHWGRPLLDTLSMSVVGTVFGALAAIPLGVLASRGGSSRRGRLRAPALLCLNTLRSIPGLLWGVLFVAAVGFGPLPGIFALAFHSTGMLGKFYAEILEHMDPAPGNALRSHGVSELGVFRFSVWPQIVPRLIDVILYRWDHNVRAATTLGMVGCGGIGQEIVVALDQFEFRETTALILVLLALVTLINTLGSTIRHRLLHASGTS
jgi:phosphonate transport system permease protein